MYYSIQLTGFYCNMLDLNKARAFQLISPRLCKREYISSFPTEIISIMFRSNSDKINHKDIKTLADSIGSTLASRNKIAPFAQNKGRQDG